MKIIKGNHCWKSVKLVSWKRIWYR